MASRLNNPDFMKFPLEMGANGAATSKRREHVREQIAQVLFTAPGERWFRPEFGVGISALVFEPNNATLWEVTKKRLLASLGEALKGEVDPSSLEVSVAGDGATLNITIGYKLATINHTEKIQFALEG